MCSCVVRTEPYLHNLAISASPNKATVTRQRQLAFGLAPQLPEGDRLQGNDERCCQIVNQCLVKPCFQVIERPLAWSLAFLQTDKPLNIFVASNSDTNFLIDFPSVSFNASSFSCVIFICATLKYRHAEKTNLSSSVLRVYSWLLSSSWSDSVSVVAVVLLYYCWFRQGTATVDCRWRRRVLFMCLTVVTTWLTTTR